MYSFDEENKSIQVDTFCAHGGPEGYITGIRGVVRCVSDEDVARVETEDERQEMIAQKCYLKFPFLPFIPKEPYDVIDTDYENFALVSGAKDKSFVQVKYILLDSLCHGIDGEGLKDFVCVTATFFWQCHFKNLSIWLLSSWKKLKKKENVNNFLPSNLPLFHA